MNNEARWQQRFQNFKNAHATFQRMIAIYEDDPEAEVAQMALTQAFEITVELSWKVLKDILEDEGFEINSPKETMRQAFKSEIIRGDDGEIWMECLKMRNLTSHTYDSATLENLLEFIANIFQFAVERLDKELESRL